MDAVQKIKLDILKKPISLVLGAYDQFITVPPIPDGSLSAQKIYAANELAYLVENGAISMLQIESCTIRNPVTSTPSLKTSETLAATADTASQALIEAKNAKTMAQNVSSDLSLLFNLTQEVKSGLNDESKYRKDSFDKVENQIEKMDRKIGTIKIDDRKVEAAVIKVVADAFKPFEKAVHAAQAQTVIAGLSSIHVVSAKTCIEAFGLDVRDRKGDPMLVEIWNAPTAPAVDPHFIWTEDILRHLLLSQDNGENIWFGGPKGTGKSETARQFAAVTGRAFKRINFHKYTCAEDYIGAVGLENGQTVFKRGDFLAAFTHPSTVILLDEVTNADPGELAPLNGFLEPDSAVSFGGSVHTRAPGVLVFAADNTMGNGDDTGRYAGTRQMNSALVDRFARVIPFDYLPRLSEIEAVVRHTGCAPELAEHVLDAVHVARSQVTTGEVIDAPSIRSVIAFIRALRVLSVQRAWATTISARQPAESLPGLSAIYASCINEAVIQKLL
jgi:MoxR-like ATPase